MYARVHSAVLSTVTAASIGAVVIAPVTPPAQVVVPRVVGEQVELAAAPALGAIPIAFLQNQATYCSLICPFLVQGAVTVPLGVVQAPVAFLDSLGANGSLTRAIGAAAAAVTGAANTAAEGIILNDVFHVVPKAFNNLEVTVVQLSDVGAALLTPSQLPGAIDTARQTILTALHQPLPPPDPTQTGAHTLPQVVAVEAIKVSAAVAFEAGELVLLGVVQTANAGAQELAKTGNPVAAVEAAATQAADVVHVASTIVKDSVDTAVTNIRAAAKQEFPTAHSTGLPVAAPKAHPSVADATSGDAVTPGKPPTARPGADRVNRVVKSLAGSHSKALHPNKSESTTDRKGRHAR
ncbi:hypothetical protein [Mycobacterium dioxanotrophicus]|uniref:hypothetical protein n=1 Tax=Mycobacterium dioxanotrophicus TaxID=482462 RepID=UPI0018DF2D36|nr:hypothetical protein [Mycobacterium dioxanotrophicus]